MTKKELTPTQELAKLKKKEDRRKAIAKKKFGERLTNFFYEISMFGFTTTGVLFSKYMPVIKAIVLGSEESISFALPYRAQIIAAMVLALLVTYFLDKGGDPEGKKRNFKRRMLSQFANGIMWHTIIGG